MNRLRIRLCAATAALATLLAGLLAGAAPAYAADTDRARVCAGLTVEAYDLILDVNLVAATVAVLNLDGRDRAADVARARDLLDCGPAPAGRSDDEVLSDTCAALDAGLLRELARDLTDEGNPKALAARDEVEDALTVAVPTVRNALDCRSLPAAPTSPTPASSSGDEGGEQVSEYPIGAPETGDGSTPISSTLR